MTHYIATAAAHPNIAFIKYWGNRDDTLNLPANGSISMNLGSLETQTRVEFDPALSADSLIINDQLQQGAALIRVQRFMDRVRVMGKTGYHARIESRSNFPISAGLASSASGYAALALAATSALGLYLSERELSGLARLGSGSAARSVPAGFVEWHTGTTHAESFAESIAPAEAWNLVDVIAVIQQGPKTTGSSHGHQLAETSPYQPCRVEGAPYRLGICRHALRERDFRMLAEIIELDSLMMHAVMMTSTPALLYWHPLTLHILQLVLGWRADGIEVCATVDAGANPHLICTAGYAQDVKQRLLSISGVESVLMSPAGGPARLLP